MGKFTGLKTIVEGEARIDDATPQTPLRPKKIGKRDHPDYTQISIYIRKTPYHNVRRRLIGTGQDFSDLVNELIERWLRDQT
jgi:hypothetical protein